MPADKKGLDESVRARVQELVGRARLGAGG
jgi:hypothetical protein